jgi:hypothetical protein
MTVVVTRVCPESPFAQQDLRSAHTALPSSPPATTPVKSYPRCRAGRIPPLKDHHQEHGCAKYQHAGVSKIAKKLAQPHNKNGTQEDTDDIA